MSFTFKSLVLFIKIVTKLLLLRPNIVAFLANYKSFIGSYKMCRENRKCGTADKILNENIFGYFSDRF